MGELVSHLKGRVIAQAIIIWLVCLVLTMMVEDDGFVFAFYAVASVLFWSGSFIYFRSRPFFGPADLWAFRLAPVGFLFLGMLSASVIDGMRSQ
jgi:hypothetical protein